MSKNVRITTHSYFGSEIWIESVTQTNHRQAVGGLEDNEAS